MKKKQPDHRVGLEFRLEDNGLDAMIKEDGKGRSVLTIFVPVEGPIPEEMYDFLKDRLPTLADHVIDTIYNASQLEALIKAQVRRPPF